jgi:TetR/AcrR family transcriptional repressor of nem operon
MGRVSDARERLLQATIDVLWARSYGAATVDDICTRAKVRKGSFYHFFRSKDELVLAALEADWQMRQTQLDALFSATAPPLERLRRYLKSVRARQEALSRRLGCVAGCVYSKLGLEVGPSSAIGRRVQGILTCYLKYFETTLRDAQAEGAPVGDVREQARALFAFLEGVAGQARIQNDLRLLDNLEQAVLGLLGLQPGERTGMAHS